MTIGESSEISTCQYCGMCILSLETPEHRAFNLIGKNLQFVIDSGHFFHNQWRCLGSGHWVMPHGYDSVSKTSNRLHDLLYLGNCNITSEIEGCKYQMRLTSIIQPVYRQIFPGLISREKCVNSNSVLLAVCRSVVMDLDRRERNFRKVK